MTRYLLKPVFYAFIMLTGLSAHGADSRAMPDTSGFRVMTYNIHHANPPSREAEGTIDLQAIARVINREKPDLVALQEIDVHTGRSGRDIDEAATLARLTGMHFHFTRALAYQGGEYGVAVLSRFPVTDTFSYKLPVGNDKKEETRVLCLIRLQFPGGRNLYFGSTHLGLSEDTRVLQANKLTEIAGTLSGPMIIGGDFNAHPDSEPLKILTRVFTRSCTTGCGFTISAQNPRNKIDYVMYRPGEAFRVTGHQVIRESYASDHLPYVVDFMWER